MGVSKAAPQPDTHPPRLSLEPTGPEVACRTPVSLMVSTQAGDAGTSREYGKKLSEFVYLFLLCICLAVYTVY